MKKILFFAAITFFAMTGASFAWTVTPSGPSTDIDTDKYPSMAEVKASKNVNIQVNSTAASYAASAGHTAGDKVYGIASNSSVIKYTTKDKGTSWTTEPGSSDISAFNSWSDL